MKRRRLYEAKRILSLILALLLVFQLTPAAAAAAEGTAETGAAITGIEIIRPAGSAIVSLNTGGRNALLIAALYTLDLQLRETKTAEVSPGDERVQLTFSQSFRDDPVHIKVMLVDPVTCAPLCASRTEYTEAQEAVTVDDFDPALVLNFDEQTDENFAVLAEGVVPLHAGEDFQRFETANEVDFTVYGMTDSARQRLGKGVKAMLFHGDNSYPVSIDSVETFAGGVTLRGAALEEQDFAAFFDYITLDREINGLNGAEMEYAEGVTAAETLQLMAGDLADDPLDVRLRLSRDTGNFKIEGTVNAQINDRFTFCFSKDEENRPHWFYDLSLDTHLELDVQLQAKINNGVFETDPETGKVKPAEFRLPLGELPVPTGVPGVELKFALSVPITVQLEGNLHVGAGVTASWRMTGCDHMEPEITYRSTPDEPKIELETGVSLDVGFQVAAVLEICKMFYVEGGGELRRELRAVLAGDLGEGRDVYHGCIVCIDGTDRLYLKAWVELGLKKGRAKRALARPEKPWDVAKKNFYISLSASDKPLKMGYGAECPNRAYRTNVNLMDARDGKQLQGKVIVWGTLQNGEIMESRYHTNGSNLPAGDYQFTAMVEGYSDSNVRYEVKAPGTVNIFLTPADGGSVSGAIEGIIQDNMKPDYRFRYSDGSLVVYEALEDISDQQILEAVLSVSGGKIYNTPRGAFSGGALVTGSYYTCEKDSYGKDCLVSKSDSVKIYTSDIRSIEFQVDFPEGEVLLIRSSPNLESVTYSGTVGGYGIDFRCCSGLTEVNGLERFEEIGNQAFQQTGLREVNLQSSRKIGICAFQECKDLTSAALGTGSVGNNAFEGCGSLRQVDFGTVTNLLDCAFRNCVSLESVNLPDTLTQLGSSVFEGCTGLERARIPGGVKYGSGVFKNCANLREVQLTPGNSDERWMIPVEMFYSCSSLKHVEIPSGVDCVGERAFAKCLSLEKVTLPNTVQAINCDAFAECPSLREIEFQGTLNEWNTACWNFRSPVTYPVLVRCMDGDTVLTQ